MLSLRNTDIATTRLPARVQAAISTQQDVSE
jgi:hypothetical protein